MFKRLCASALLFACPTSVLAQAAPYEEYAVHLRAAQEVTPQTSSEFGDQVSLYNGATEFDVVDIDVPGNNALPVQLRRRFEISDRRLQFGSHLGGFGEWDLDVPYLEGVFSQQYGWQVGTPTTGPSYARCTNPAPPYTNPYSGDDADYGSPDEIWDGYQMHMPGGGFKDLLVNTQAQLPGITSGNYPWITKDYTRITCLPSTQNDSGEGFLAVAPDGTKTSFGWVVVKPYSSVLTDITYTSIDGTNWTAVPTYAPRSKVFMLATSMEDRFGNTVTYSYGTDASGNTILTQIQSSDGRTITPKYTNGVITSVTSNVGKWTYGYVSANPTYSGYEQGLSLNSVTRPDQSTWTYLATGRIKSDWAFKDDSQPPKEPHCQIEAETPVGAFTYNVTSPFGATASYQFYIQRHNRSYIPKSCDDQVAIHNYPKVYDFVDNYTLVSKQVSGLGLPTGASTLTWSYSYLDHFGNNYFDASVPYSGWTNQDYVPPGNCPSATPCALSKQVVVTSPTEITKYTFGVQYARNEGRLLGTEVDALDGTTVLRTTTNTYVADSALGGLGLPFPNYVGTDLASNYKNPMTAWIRPQQQVATLQDGVTFTNQTNAWDVFARPISVTRSSTLGYTKTEDTTYADNTTNWVIGQIASVADDASKQFIVQNYYDPNSAMLTSTASFGALQKSYTYNPLGTLKTVADGLGQTTTLAKWNRGIPQLVTHADTTTEQAAVNDSGWITSYIDENGYKTSYGYDPMGRVNQIIYPTGDTVAWAPTSITLAPASSADGPLAGYWKQTISTGTRIDVTWFDAMLHPLVTEKADTAGVSGNASPDIICNPCGGPPSSTPTSFVAYAYDGAGRDVFTSYPLATQPAISPGVGVGNGVRTTYDALGRTLTSTQDSEWLSLNGSSINSLTTRTQYVSGFETVVTNPRGFVTSTAYQTFDSPDTSHPTIISSPQGVTTVIARDIYGKPLTLTRSGTWNGSPISETRSYHYDAYQRLCQRVEPETGTTVLGYDAANNLAWTESGNPNPAACPTTITSTPPSDAIIRTYDLLNRPQTVSVPGSTGIAYNYWPDGELHKLTSGSGATANTWTYTYNTRRLPVTENLVIDGRSHTFTHGYDTLGHESSLTWPNGLVVATAPNALNQPTQAGTYATGVTYFPNGGMSGFTYGNGIVHTLTENTRELPWRSLDQAPAGAAILDDTYTYDANANVSGITDGTTVGTIVGPNSRTMAYDALDRLTGTSAPNEPWVAASTIYDPLDNIRSNSLGTGPSTTRTYSYSYDPTSWRLSQLASTGNTVVPMMTIGYDIHGNIASKGNGFDSYSFDAANRLQTVIGKEGYEYDGYGRRVKVTTLGGVNAGKLDYPIYDMSGQLLAEDDQRSNQTINYISLNGSLVAKISAPIGGTAWTTTYEHTDALRSPTYETNAAETLTRTERYTPFGEPSVGPYVQGPGFTGHVTDAATGLTYAQQRYYDPVLGRFLSPDPVQANDKGGSFNRYWYANNNPYKFTDPDGRCAEGSTCDQMVQNYGKWADANPKEADKFGKVGVAATGAMLTGPLVLAALPEAAGASAVVAADAETTAVTAARAAAAAARASGATGGATSATVTEAGEVFTGASTNAGGPGAATNAVVRQALDKITPALRSVFHGCCGEVDAASKVLNSGASMQGSVTAAVRTMTGEILEGCPTCARLVDRLGGNLVDPPAPPPQ